VLTRESWEGAELRSIICEALAPYRGRFDVEGSILRLTPRMALALAMALHELCTNAAKYGSLAVPQGRVSITWTVSEEGRRLVLRWKELNGPPVSPPTRRGFGTRMIRQSVRAGRSGLYGRRPRGTGHEAGFLAMRLSAPGPLAPSAQDC
jgi:two-component sensor histidine kinase